MEHKQNENVILAPSNAFAALAMLLAGLDGSSLSQLEGVMHVSRDALLAQFSALAESGSKNVISESSSAWLSNKVTLLESYLVTLKNTFGADAHHQVDFGSSASENEAVRASINRWVASHTNNNIQELLPPASISGLTRLVLASAIHFLGNWKSPFKFGFTEKAPFTLADEVSKTQVELMSQTTVFNYLHDKQGGLAALVLPYQDSSAEMVVLLPESAASFNDLLSHENSARLQDLLLQSSAAGSWEAVKVAVKLPKFEFATSADLVSSVRSLGATDLFSSDQLNLGSALTQAVGHGIAVTNIFHQARIRVDEKGTEASAATGAIAGLAKRKTAEKIIEFTCDRPFLFGIVDSKRILFIGAVHKP